MILYLLIVAIKISMRVSKLDHCTFVSHFKFYSFLNDEIEIARKSTTLLFVLGIGKFVMVTNFDIEQPNCKRERKEREGKNWGGCKYAHHNLDFGVSNLKRQNTERTKMRTEQNICFALV